MKPKGFAIVPLLIMIGAIIAFSVMAFLVVRGYTPDTYAYRTTSGTHPLCQWIEIYKKTDGNILSTLNICEDGVTNFKQSGNTLILKTGCGGVYRYNIPSGKGTLKKGDARCVGGLEIIDKSSKNINDATNTNSASNTNGANENTNLPLGGDRDEHGCVGSAGYAWCESAQKCQRSWEEACPSDVNAASNANTNTSDVQATTTSYGLWFPFNDGQTTNNPRPTIYGKVEQNTRVYLGTTFEKKDWVGLSFGEAKTLTFKPGTVQNLTVTLDGQSVTSLSGFAQYPAVVCWKQNFNADGTKTYDPATGKWLPEDTLYATEEECRTALAESMPPLIFVFQPATDLSQGVHTLVVNGVSMRFTYDPAFAIAQQPIQKTLDARDSCSPGYYHDKNHFPIALPTQRNTNLGYGISFPQSEEEKGSIQRRRVELSIAGKRYPLFFPDSTTYSQGKSNSGFSGLYAPLQNLVYSDGTPATPWALRQSTDLPEMITGYYSEIYPVDVAGYEYRGQSIPRAMSTSSGCDG